MVSPLVEIDRMAVRRADVSRSTREYHGLVKDSR